MNADSICIHPRFSWYLSILPQFLGTSNKKRLNYNRFSEQFFNLGYHIANDIYVR